MFKVQKGTSQSKEACTFLAYQNNYDCEIFPCRYLKSVVDLQDYTCYNF